jgi:uncharacterized protein YkwD
MRRKAVALVLASTLVSCALLGLAGSAAAERANVIAPATACPHQGSRAAAAGLQLKAMLCMTNYARRASGLKPLTLARPLAEAADHKSADILRCDEFSHEACGHEFTYWIERFGYTHGCWSAGENIGYGTGSLGSVRNIFSAWINSSGHRANILGEFTDIGIGHRIGTVEGSAGAVVWTQDFGSHVCRRAS